MNRITKRARFYGKRTNPTPKTFHIETDGAVVNIMVGLTDFDGHLVTAVEVIPEGENRGGDGEGRIWVQDGTRVIRLHDWESAEGVPKGCTCIEEGDACGMVHEPSLRTCAVCGRSWCHRCNRKCLFDAEHAPTGDALSVDSEWRKWPTERLEGLLDKLAQDSALWEAVNDELAEREHESQIRIDNGGILP